MANKTILKCRACHFVWENKESKQLVLCPNCGRIKDARDRRAYSKKYIEMHPDRLVKLKAFSADKVIQRQRMKKWRESLRESVLLLVGGTGYKCENCGCADRRLLEINHINGGGNKELQKGKNSMRFYLDIASKKRSTQDLNILCKVCNNLYSLTMKYGKLPYKVTYK